MKKIITASILLVFGLAYAQDVPDQNPNYQKSKDYYMNNYTQYTKTQGTTGQQTYTPYVEPNRMTMRHDRRMARIEGRADVRVARANRPVYTRGGRNGWNQGYQQGFNTVNPSYGYGYRRGRGNRGGFRPYSNVGLHWGRNGIRPYWNVGLGWGY